MQEASRRSAGFIVLWVEKRMSNPSDSRGSRHETVIAPLNESVGIVGNVHLGRVDHAPECLKNEFLFDADINYPKLGRGDNGHGLLKPLSTHYKWCAHLTDLSSRERGIRLESPIDSA